MRLQFYLALIGTFFLSLATAAEQERDIDIFAWPLSASKPQTFAKITYNSANASIKSFTAPSIPPSDEIVRVGFYHPPGSWSGVATASSNFAADKSKTLQLHVKPNGELYHVGFKTAEPVSQGKGKSTKEGLTVEVKKISPGPLPHLNKPVVVSADGTVDQKEPEKSFLQKYWWAIGLFLLFQLVMGGGGKE